MFHLNSKKQKEISENKNKKIILSLLTLLLLLGGIAAAASFGHDALAYRNRRHRNSQTQPTTTPPPVTSTSGSTSGTAQPVPVTTPTPTTGTPTQAPSSLPFADALVGYWKLNGNANGALGKDNGTTFGNVTYVPGKFGQAAHFDGKSYIEVPDQNYFSPSTFGQKTTVSFWFKPDTYNFPGINEGYVNFLGKSDFTNGANSEWEFRVDNETAYDGFARPERMNFYAFNQTAGLGAGSAMNLACPLNTWTHVVGEIDGANTKLYINGKLVDKDALSAYNIHMSNTSAPLRIGTSDKESFLQGSLSNVMIYNRDLSDSEVSQLYQADLSK